MSLNKYMHDRNKYKNKKPNFLELALKYPDFRKQITQDEKGKVYLDFKNADALRALTTCLLKEDFDLSVHLPSDRLVPTLPLRLNYLHWLEDIVGCGSGKWGVDVGTGASCVYPLLGKTVQGWNFLATEADPENFYHAKKNVETNNAQEQIHVKKVSVDDILLEPVESFKAVEEFAFCMCNPPFFADHMEAQAVSTTRSVDRAEAHSVSTASPQECIAKGGEVGFIRQMIEESTILKNRIRVYSSMVGKKASLVQLKEELRQLKVPKFATTDFCQGKTMRWGIAWSFDESISFPKSQFEGKKDKKPIHYAIPEGSGGVQYNVHSIAGFLKDVLTSIKVHCYQGKIAKSYTSITITAPENTWCHQRRQRRQKKRQVQADKEAAKKRDAEKNDEEVVRGKDKAEPSTSNSQEMETTSSTMEPTAISEKEIINDAETTKVKELNNVDTDKDVSGRKRFLEEEEGGSEGEVKPVKVSRIEDDTKKDKASNRKEKLNENSFEKEPTTNAKAAEDLSVKASVDGVQSSPEKQADALLGTKSPNDYVLKCVMRLKRTDSVINMELEWLDGTSRELLHQVKTFLINKLGEHEKE